MNLELFKAKITQGLKEELELIITENRWSMLSLSKKRGEPLKLFMHKMFLEAPENVLHALSQFVRGKRPEKGVLRSYIQHHFNQTDYTHLVHAEKLMHKGRYYDLQALYDALNARYFGGELILAITWYGSAEKNGARRVTYGQYLAGLRLIKIHRMLDTPFFPEYFVSFVIYHEMLHSVVSGAIDKKGRYCIHHAPFKAREKLFERYSEAVAWERIHKEKILSYGWT